METVSKKKRGRPQTAQRPRATHELLQTVTFLITTRTVISVANKSCTTNQIMIPWAILKTNSGPRKPPDRVCDPLLRTPMPLHESPWQLPPLAHKRFQRDTMKSIATIVGPKEHRLLDWR